MVSCRHSTRITNKQRKEKNNMKIEKQKCIRVAAITLAALTLTTSARADAVVDWNIITAQTIPFATRAGGSPGLDFAMVHAAIHDAVQAYDGRFEPYAVEITGASGSPVAAVAKAAHDVLAARFPAQSGSLDATYNAYLASHGGLAQ